MRVTFASQSAQRSDDLANTTERLINLFSEPSAEGSKAGVTLRGVLGTETFATLTDSRLTRAIIQLNGDFYVAASAKLLKITSAGVVTTLGTILDDVETSMSVNGDSVTLAAGGTYYVWDGSTLTAPTGGIITNVGSVGFQDGYTILTDKDSGQFEWTELGLPKTRNGLYFATAETQNDKLKRVVVNGREVWLLGEFSSEVWANSGQSGANAFRRAAAIDRGILEPRLIAKVADVQIMVGDDGVVYSLAGFNMNPVSTPPVEASIEASTPTHCFLYEDRGRKFVVVRFSDRPSWVFDLTTGRWHERASGVDLNAWEILDTVRLGQSWYGLTNNGAIHKFARNSKDTTEPLARVMQSKPFFRNGDQFSTRFLELQGEIGTSDLGREAKVMLHTSRDGHTWGPSTERSFGKLGQNSVRARWHSLGDSREISFRFVVTDPADINLYGAGNIEVSP